MQVINVVLRLGKASLTATVVDRRGHRRAIDVQWQTKEFTNVPPKDWMETVRQEIEYQLTEEDAKESGRWIP